MQLKQLAITRGNTQNYPLTFKKADGSLYCLKNWALFFTLKTEYSLPDAQASLQKIITTFSDTTSGTSGSTNLLLLPEDTNNLDVGDYDFDIKVRTSTSEVFTVMKGKFTIEYGVTDSQGTAGTAA